MNTDERGKSKIQNSKFKIQKQQSGVNPPHSKAFGLPSEVRGGRLGRRCGGREIQAAEHFLKARILPKAV